MDEVKYCCSGFDNAIVEGTIGPCRCGRDWFINLRTRLEAKRIENIFYCPFCGAKLKGDG